MAAGYQRGNVSAGLSSTFGTAAGSLFHVVAYFWQSRIENALKVRYGRETSGELSFRFIRPGGSVLIRGDIPDKVCPEPTSWIGQKTTLVVQVAASKTVTFSLVVESFDVDSVQKENDLWAFTATCKVTAKPVYSGFDAATDGGAVTKSDVTLYGGETIYDPAAVALQGSFVTVIDWWADLDDDTDADVLAKLQDAITNATIPSGMKQRPGSITQDAPDGGVITLRFGLTDTNDDVLNPSTTRTDDPSDLEDQETTTALNTTPGNGEISGLVSRGIRYIKHNDNATQQVKIWGRTSTQDDWEYPRSIQNTDASTIAVHSAYGEAHVTASSTSSDPTPASGYKLRFKRRERLTNAGKYGWTYELGLTTPQEDIENEASSVYTDPSGIADNTVHGRIVATATTANPSSAPSGLSLYGTATKELHDNGFLRRFDYRLLTREEEIEHRGTSAIATNLMPGSASIIDNETLVDTCLSSDSIEDLLNTAYATYRNTAGFESLSGSKLNKTRWQLRIHRKKDDLIVAVTNCFVRRETLGVLAGGTSGAVRISKAVELDSGNYSVLIGAQTAWVAYKTIAIMRRVTGFDHLSDGLFLSYEGLVNDDTLLSFPAQTAMYQGTTLHANWNLEGTARTQYMIHMLSYRSIGHFDDGVVRPLIGRWVPSQNSAVSGSTLALNQIDSGWIADAAGDADLSFLIA